MMEWVAFLLIVGSGVIAGVAVMIPYLYYRRDVDRIMNKSRTAQTK